MSLAVLMRTRLTVNIVWLGSRGVAKEQGLSEGPGSSDLDSLIVGCMVSHTIQIMLSKEKKKARRTEPEERMFSENFCPDLRV